MQVYHRIPCLPCHPKHCMDAPNMNIDSIDNKCKSFHNVDMDKGSVKPKLR